MAALADKLRSRATPTPALVEDVLALANVVLEGGDQLHGMQLLELTLELAGAAGDVCEALRQDVGVQLDALRSAIIQDLHNPNEIKNWVLKSVETVPGCDAQEVSDEVLNVVQEWSQVALLLQVAPGDQGKPLKAAEQGRNSKRKVLIAPSPGESSLQQLCKKSLPKACFEAMWDNLPAPKAAAKAHGQNYIVVTAPHGTRVLRKGNEVHLPETYTPFLAEKMASRLQGTSISWSDGEIFRSNATKHVIHSALDPNHTPLGEEASTPFFHNLSCVINAWKVGGLHIDCHGRRNWKVDGVPGAITLGFGAMERYASSSFVNRFLFNERLLAFKEDLLTSLQQNLSPDWIVDADPKFAGKGGDSYRTMTRQSVDIANGWINAVQVEISRDFRVAMLVDTALLDKVAASISEISEKHNPGFGQGCHIL